jgi:hypothetical protein
MSLKADARYGAPGAGNNALKAGNSGGHYTSALREV